MVMPSKAPVIIFYLEPQLAPGASAGGKIRVFCRALKPVLDLSRNGIQRTLGPHNHQWGTHPSDPPPATWVGVSPVHRPHVTSIVDSRKRKYVLEIGKDSEDRK